MNTAMSESNPELTVYLNGAFLPRSKAKLDVEDRGVLFGDGVYEVVYYFHGQAFLFDEHVARLARSLAAIRLAPPTDLHAMRRVCDELVARNGLTNGHVYWQITRGPAPRHPLFPDHPNPTVLLIARPSPPLDMAAPPRALAAILTPDERWHHPHVKSLMLLPNVLAANAAHDAGADMAILHRDGVVTESTSANLFIVKDGQLITHPADQWILGGITRSFLLQLAKETGVPTEEMPFAIDAMLQADEVLACGTTTHIAAVTQVDGRVIGAGQPGPVTSKLLHAFREAVVQQCDNG